MPPFLKTMVLLSFLLAPVCGQAVERGLTTEPTPTDTGSVPMEVDGALFLDRVADGSEREARDKQERYLQSLESTLQEEPLNALKGMLEDCVQRPAPSLCQYRLARVHFALSVMHKLRNEKKQGRQELEEALDQARASLKSDDRSARAHTLLADLWGERLAVYGGFLAGPKFGPKVKGENEKAVSLAPEDPVVLAGLGRQYLLAPGTFGGDVPKAIDLFKRSLALDPTSGATYVWLARAYRKMKDRAAFKQALDNALRLQPENAQAKWERSQWPEEQE